MKRLLAFVAMFIFAASCFAELTPDQKRSDFMTLVGLYNKNYGPYEWKKKAFGFDLLQIAPWLAQVDASTDDLSFYDICVRYVASLNDFHDEFLLPSSYEAFLPLTADIYDGKILIDFIDPFLLDPTIYTFAVGDELISVDKVSVTDLIESLGPYSVNGQSNPVSRNRLAAAAMLDRVQFFYTYANRVKQGDVATIEVKSQGKISSFKIPWFISGVPLDSEGRVPNPKTMSSAMKSLPEGKEIKHSMRERARASQNLWGVWTGAPALREVRPVPRYMEPLKRLQNFSVVHPGHQPAGSIFPFGSMFPSFNPPPGFKLRLGSSRVDEFLSGTFPAGKSTIGFIRIPSFEPNSETNALQQFQDEITFFQKNTNGLVIDLMSNGGGDGCYANFLAQDLIPRPFHTIGLELRATENWVLLFSDAILNAEFFGASDTTLELLNDYLNDVQKALAENRGLTGPLPFPCIADRAGFTYPPAMDENGNILAYTKPIVVLTDNFSASAAEFFSATLQDAKRVTVYGVRTSGGGGDVVEFTAGPYSEGNARVTLALGVRAENITTPGLPTAPLIENIGIQPDVTADFQTKQNLLNGGKTFVKGFTSVMSNLIAIGHP